MKRLLKSYINAMANDINAINSRLESSGDVIIDHILAIMCAECEGNPYKSSISYWYKEMSKKFKKIQKLRQGNKVRSVTSSEIYEQTWLTWKNSLTTKNVSMRMKNFTHDDHPGLYYGQYLDILRLKSICDDYFRYVSNSIIENDGVPDVSDCAEYTKSLFESKYPVIQG